MSEYEEYKDKLFKSLVQIGYTNDQAESIVKAMLKGEQK
jgi:Holliday junction resolvasome RuvABC DNA-binding subunit